MFLFFFFSKNGIINHRTRIPLNVPQSIFDTAGCYHTFDIVFAIFGGNIKTFCTDTFLLLWLKECVEGLCRGRTLPLGFNLFSPQNLMSGG